MSNFEVIYENDGFYVEREFDRMEFPAGSFEAILNDEDMEMVSAPDVFRVKLRPSGGFPGFLKGTYSTAAEAQRQCDWCASESDRIFGKRAGV